ncbi:MAG: hypothetical protein ACK5PQ_02360, partial [Alphaproteobacteria bacterium]
DIGINNMHVSGICANHLFKSFSQVLTANSVVAEKSNAERYDTHFSAFDLSAQSGFLVLL